MVELLSEVLAVAVEVDEETVSDVVAELETEVADAAV